MDEPTVVVIRHAAAHYLNWRLATVVGPTDDGRVRVQYLNGTFMTFKENDMEHITNAQLVEIYNAKAEKPVKKFRDRATALRRLEEIGVDEAALRFILDPEGVSPADETSYSDTTEQEETPMAKAKANGKTPAKRGRKPSFDTSQKVKILADGNPKREGTASFERFKGYRNGATLAKCMENGVTAADVRYDLGKGFIELVS